MASVVKSTSGSAVTYAVTDMTGAIATVVQNTGLITGPTVQFSGAAVHEDAVNTIATLLLQMGTGLTPQVNGT